MDSRPAYRKRWSQEEEASVGRAKAILQERYKWTEGQAYRCLQMSAHNSGLTIPGVARRVIVENGDLPFAGPGQVKAKMGFCLTWPDRESRRPENLST